MTTSWKPKFKPSSESCKIQSYSETRARLLAGGTFFRSKLVGSQWNSIVLTLTVSTLNAAGFLNPSPSTHPRWNVSWSNTTSVAELTVQHTFSNYLDYYYVQQGLVNVIPPPECTRHAPDALRTQVNTDTLAIIEMPTNDVQAPWNSSVDELTTCLLTTFTSSMSGGDSGPAGAANVRTGPEKAIIYINQSEINSPTGVLQDIQELREFNGSVWVAYTGIL